MTASDCYKIGLETIPNQNYHFYTVLWLNEALNRLEPNAEPSFKLDILHNLATVHSRQS